MIGHDVPAWRLYTNEAVQTYRERVKAYVATDPGWKVGPSVLAQLNRELMDRGVE